jgi:hypothetical protein
MDLYDRFLDRLVKKSAAVVDSAIINKPQASAPVSISFAPIGKAISNAAKAIKNSMTNIPQTTIGMNTGVAVGNPPPKK